ncbi:hypothetical protein [Breoghania sp. L-A4]|uniref:hypothetical protein n=1 Tax=Breoghania sp. L-A4 TaxID=2304600 RepID=UPI0013C2BD63|nr:hypothetical protein [Breoghania sp. L-A4]
METNSKNISLVSLSPAVRARILFGREVRIENTRDTKLFDEEYLKGVLKNKVYWTKQRDIFAKTMVISIFIIYLIVNGGDIKVPGIGISIKEIPGILYILVPYCSFNALFLVFAFVNEDIYSALIDQIIIKKSEYGVVDPDLVKAAYEPQFFIHKLFRADFNIYDTNSINPQGASLLVSVIITFGFLVTIFTPLLGAAVYLIYSSIYYIDNSVIGICVKLFSICCILFGLFVIIAVYKNQTYKDIDYKNVEKIDEDSS